MAAPAPNLQDVRPLQVTLWFLVHRPHQILFLDFYLIIGFYLIISTAHVQNDHVVQNKCDNDIHLQNNEIHKVKREKPPARMQLEKFLDQKP